jgi:hypothetical protein
MISELTQFFSFVRPASRQKKDSRELWELRQGVRKAQLQSRLRHSVLRDAVYQEGHQLASFRAGNKYF